MDLQFEGDDFSDNDLEGLGATGEGVNEAQRLARKKKLAQLVQEQVGKKLRAVHGSVVIRSHGKVKK